jgi:hypothetical protein
VSLPTSSDFSERSLEHFRARARLRWPEPSEGGRSSEAPPGPLYAATAHFLDETTWDFGLGERDNDVLSIVLRLDDARPSARWTEVDIGFLNEEAVEMRLRERESPSEK